MREIKFQYVFEVPGTICKRTLTLALEDIEEGLAARSSFPSGTKMIAKRQYTGLKDVNGVEIYEGDIIEDHAGVGSVVYSEKKAAFKVDYHDGWAKWFLDYTLKGERESIKVIGNIHENPELIKENK